MSEQLERLLPILALIPGVNIPAGVLQSVYIAASQQKIDQLERALRYEVELLNQKLEAGKLSLDREYIKSDGFTANVIQALRAAEIADSKKKIEIIAKSLSSCTIAISKGKINRVQCMRIIEQISTEELEILANIPIPVEKSDTYLGVPESSIPNFSEESLSLLFGLSQLGLIADRSTSLQPHKWSVTKLAEDIIWLIREKGADERS